MFKSQIQPYKNITHLLGLTLSELVSPLSCHGQWELTALEICYPFVSNTLEPPQVLMIFLLTDLQWAAVWTGHVLVLCKFLSRNSVNERVQCVYLKVFSQLLLKMSKGELGSGFDCSLVGEPTEKDCGFLFWVRRRELVFSTCLLPKAQGPGNRAFWTWTGGLVWIWAIFWCLFINLHDQTPMQMSSKYFRATNGLY